MFLKMNLDKTRVKLYEETKNMTVEEHVTYIHSLAAPILQEYGLKAVNRYRKRRTGKKRSYRVKF
jgi:hypothetical protein